MNPLQALMMVDDLVRRAAEGRPVSHETLMIALVLAGYSEPDARGLATRLLAEVSRAKTA